MDSPSSPSCEEREGKEKKRCGGKYHGKHHHGKDHHGKGHYQSKRCRRFPGSDSPLPEHRKQHLEQKLIFLNHCIDALNAMEESQLYPWDLRRKERLLKKGKESPLVLAAIVLVSKELNYLRMRNNSMEL